MNYLKQIFNFYINSSIHVALAVYSLVRITEFYLELPYNESLSCFIFYLTITGYNFVKYAAVAKLQHSSLTNSLKAIQVFSFICFLLTVYYGSKLQLKTLFLLLPFMLLTFLYAIPLTKNLRNIPSIKIIVVAFVWAGVTVLLPVWDVEMVLSLKLFLLFIQRLFFVMVLTLPFDIRDFRLDDKSLQTIPQLIGIKCTKKLGFILLIITLFIEFFVAPNRTFKLIFLIAFLVTLILLQRANIKQHKYYASFWVEAIPVFWWILLLIF